MTYTNPYKSKYAKPTQPVIPEPSSLPKVDKNIQITPSKCGSKYHLDLLKELNDSIFYPAITPTDRQRIMSSATAYSKRHKCKLAARSVTENNIEGVRVWKVA